MAAKHIGQGWEANRLARESFFHGPLPSYSTDIQVLATDITARGPSTAGRRQ